MHIDSDLRTRSGIVVAFSERQGGVSKAPFGTLNLAGHVGDDPGAVDENRTRLMETLDLGDLRDRLVTAEQVHGTFVTEVTSVDVGAGAWAASGLPQVSATDGLLTTVVGMPLLMSYADCVPVILVVERPIRTVAVIHAGWRGALQGIAGSAARRVAIRAGTGTEAVLAYIGAHIGVCCYDVDEALVSQFCNRFGTICAVDGRLDLSVAITESLSRAGVQSDSIATLDTCTRDRTDHFFSYRARQVTGRHGALAAITKGE